MGSCSEVTRLLKYFNEEMLSFDQNKDKNMGEYEKMQLAFLKTYPKNICMLADTKRRYPYYLLVDCKGLIKIHGSSIAAKIDNKPYWICCQNIVISTVTEREMSKTVVPIPLEMIDRLSKIEQKMIRKIAENIKTNFVEIEEVPSSLLKFYRRKNRIQMFKELFKQEKVYLETEEDIEKVLYFYLTEGKDTMDHNARILGINDKIKNHAMTMIKKRHALIKISERTKLQVDENSQIVDILSNSQYLGILIKSSSQPVLEAIEAVRRCPKVLLEYKKALEKRNMGHAAAQIDIVEEEEEGDSEKEEMVEEKKVEKKRTGKGRARKGNTKKLIVRGDGHLPEEEINIEVNKESDITFVYLLNKNVALAFYTSISEVLGKRKPPIGCNCSLLQATS